MSTFFVSVPRTFPRVVILVWNSRPFLKCFFLRLSLFLDVTQLWLVVSYWRFGKAYRSHPQGSSSPRRPLKMERRLYRHVGNYPPTLWNIPEERRLQTTPQWKPEIPYHFLSFTSVLVLNTIVEARRNWNRSRIGFTMRDGMARSVATSWL